MFEKILVPLDGSNAAEKVLPYVIEIASGFGSRIILTSVSEPRDSFGAVETRSYLKEVTEKVELQLKDRKAESETEVCSQHRLGNAAFEILDLANKVDCSLIAMAGRGASGEGPWSLGSVAAKVLQASSIPILLVKKQAEDLALKEKKLVTKILVPLDGSELSEVAIPMAVALAKMLKSKIVLFQVMKPIGSLVTEKTKTRLIFTWADEYERLFKDSMLEYLNKTKETVQKNVADVSVAMAKGSPAGQIIEYSQANDIDLIAMSTHGRSGISRWVLGSVTDKVLLAGDKPVLVVRPRRT